MVSFFEINTNRFFDQTFQICTEIQIFTFDFPCVFGRNIFRVRPQLSV